MKCKDCMRYGACKMFGANICEKYDDVDKRCKDFFKNPLETHTLGGNDEGQNS